MQSQMADQQDQMQRRHQIQDLALHFVTQGPDGSSAFDQQGYTNALMGIDPQAALELHRNTIAGQMADLQAQKAQRDLNTPDLRKIEQGSNVLTQEQQADGSYKTIATANRFAPQQPSETDRKIAALRGLGASNDQIKAAFGLTGSSGDGDLTPDAVDNMAWDQILTGTRPQYSRGKSGDAIRNQVNNRIAQVSKEAGVGPQELATVSGRNKAIQGSLAYTQKQADALERQEETFDKNFDTMLALGDKVGRTGIPAFNKMLLNAKSNIGGDPDTAAFLTARNLVAQEYAKIASAATGAAGTTDSSREHALEAINASQTPDQLRAVYRALKQDIQNQKQANVDKLNDLTARKVQFGNVSPTMSQPSPAPQVSAPATGGWSARRID